MSDISETFSQTARPLPRTRTAAWSKEGANAETAWRRWATQHRAAAAMLGGLAGVQIASLFGFWLGGIGLDRLDFNTANGAIFLPKATPVQMFLIGGLSHYMDGVFFGLIFAVAAWPLLPLPATRAGNLAKAMIFSTVLAIVAAFLVLPLAFGPLYGRHNDFLIAFHLGWKYAFSILVVHWIYGAQLGLIYSPLDEPSSD